MRVYSGSSCDNSITINSRRNSVTGILKNDRIRLEINKLDGKLTKIGTLRLFSSNMGLIIFVIIFVYLVLSNITNLHLLNNVWVSHIVYIFLITFYIAAIMFSVIRYHSSRMHSAEHKVIYCMENNIALSKQNVLQAEWFSIDCGSTTTLTYFIVLIAYYLSFIFFQHHIFIQLFIFIFAPIIVSSIIKLIANYKIPFLYIAIRKFQRLFCLPPKKENLLLAITIGLKIQELDNKYDQFS